MEQINPLKYPIFDSHAHYYDAAFEPNFEQTVEEIQKNGVVGVINCGDNYASSEKCIELSKKIDVFYAAVGVHPETLYKNETLNKNILEDFTKNPKTVAIGEIGLDYHWDLFPRDVQKQWFEEQVILANELDMPIIVHDREAHFDTMEILKKHKPKGVVHCFSGSVEMAEEILKLGMYIGIGGVVTFKNARKAVDVVKMLPMDRLLLETDAPYLSPVPFRGKVCRSDYIFYTAEKIAEIKNEAISKVITCSLHNTGDLFNIDTDKYFSC